MTSRSTPTTTPSTRSELTSKPRVPFENFVTPDNKDLATPEALAFLRQMLCYDFQERITAREALAHPFFASVAKTQ